MGLSFATGMATEENPMDNVTKNTNRKMLKKNLLIGGGAALTLAVAKILLVECNFGNKLLETKFATVNDQSNFVARLAKKIVAAWAGLENFAAFRNCKNWKTKTLHTLINALIIMIPLLISGYKTKKAWKSQSMLENKGNNNNILSIAFNGINENELNDIFKEDKE